MLPLTDYALNDKVITQIYRMELELNSNSLYRLQGKKNLIKQKLKQMENEEDSAYNSIYKKAVKYFKIMQDIKKYITDLF